ncbi:hypothetical protein Poly30_11010 [Planctomycetes bacterium Poly30]|uniref:Peptidase C-terminal archaeal/bacterial domain-containing protein n=1 Tax=Saltatorellus ferox TaxID=2528018 RepID=A0A518ENE2_9BACT|nr:hypothetical protein Poly30_11010 [Planctomycetes bacterium Poly30]
MPQPPLHSSSLRVALLLTGSVFAASCSSSSDDPAPEPAPVSFARTELEPNDSSATAASLARGAFGTGEVDVAGDIDYWAFTMEAGEIVQIEASAARMDRLAWTANSNALQLTIWDTDGTTALLAHDPFGNFSDGWDWGPHDLDIPMFVAPAAGTYYASVTQAETSRNGSVYGIRITKLDIGQRQFEAEAVGVTGVNDTFATAEPMTEGTMFGFLEGAVGGGAALGSFDIDWYAFSITEPTHVHLEVSSYRNGLSTDSTDYVNSEITLFGSDGETRIKHAEWALFYDPAMSLTLSTAGTYYIRIQHTGGSGSGPYALLMDQRSTETQMTELEPNNSISSAMAVEFGNQFKGVSSGTEVDMWSFQGRAGDIVYAQFYESAYYAGVATPGNPRIDASFIAPDGVTEVAATTDLGRYKILRTILTEDGEQFLAVGGQSFGAMSRGIDEYEYKVKIDRSPAAQMEIEPNDTNLDAIAINSVGRAAGVISVQDDVDSWSFTAKANEAVTFVAYASYNNSYSWGAIGLAGFGSRLEAELAVEDGEGTQLATTSQVGLAAMEQGFGSSTESVVDPVPSVQITFIAPAAGTYYLKVADENADFGPNHKYVIQRK